MVSIGVILTLRLLCKKSLGRASAPCSKWYNPGREMVHFKHSDLYLLVEFI